MTRAECYEALCAQIPTSLSEEWDNDGVMCCADLGREVKRVLTVLDVTDEAVSYAIDGGFDLILSHHPLVFKGLAHVSPSDPVSARVIRLILADVAVFSFHTRLDAVDGGVNDVLADLLGLQDCQPFGGLGRIGTLRAPMRGEELGQLVAERLDVFGVQVAQPKRMVQRVAVVGGEGKDLIPAAVAAGAEALVSGRVGYHAMLDAPICLVEAGHYHTERPVTDCLASLVREVTPGVFTEVYAQSPLGWVTAR